MRATVFFIADIRSFYSPLPERRSYFSALKGVVLPCDDVSFFSPFLTVNRVCSALDFSALVSSSLYFSWVVIYVL